MAWTIDRNSGADVAITTSTIAALGANAAIYLPGTGTVVANVLVNGYEWHTGTVASLNGNGALDRLVGSGNNDLVIWDAGTLSGFVLPGGLGRARLPTGNANQRIEVFDLGAGNDLLNLTANTASLASGASPGVYNFAVTAYGGDGNDILAASEQGDALFGDVGTLTPDSDTVYGFAGNDTIFGDNGSTAIDETAGSNDTLYGGAGNDLVRGEGGTDSLFGDDGTDTLYGGGGNDNVFGDAGSVVSDETIGSSDTLYGGAGDDLMRGEGGTDSLFGDDGADTLYGGGGDDRLFGGSDSAIDTLFAGVGDDTVYGGDGADQIFLSAGTDTGYGGGGDDTFSYNPDLDQLDSQFVVRLWSGEGANPGATITIAGGSGYNWSNDLFRGDGGIDTISLTNGNNLLLFNTGDLSIDGVSNPQTAGRFTDVEVVLAGGGNDIVQLNNATGGDVVDPLAITLFGGGGADILISALGDDLVVGHNPAGIGAADANDIDTLYGGGGSDTIFGDAFNQTAGLQGGNDTLYGGGNNDTVFGNAGNDVIYGDSSETLTPGVDRLYGGEGNDLVFAGGDADLVEGDAGDDTLFGQGGADTMGGGIGTDTLYGAGADDQFNFAPDHTFTGDVDDFVIVRFGEITGGTSTLAISGGAAARSFDFFYGGNGIDTLFGNNGANVVVMNTGDLTIDGVVQSAGGGRLVDVEVFRMGGGDDIVVLNDALQSQTYTADATIFGGSLADFLASGTGNDVLIGGERDSAPSDIFDIDTIYGGGGNDTIYGDADLATGDAAGAADTLYGGTGDDTMFGNAGNDLLFGSAGIDSFDGGQGDDTLFAFPDNSTVGDGATDFVQGWDGEGNTQAFSYNGLTANWSFDRFDGGAGESDTLVGGDRANVILANTDDFYVDGVAQASNPNRLAGIEIVLLGAGADILLVNDPTGQTTIGTVFGTGLTVSGGEGADTVVTGAGNDVLYGSFIGVGAAGDPGDYLAAGAGSDTLFGHDGSDTVFGGSGIDTAYGGDANDTVVGGDGHDVLQGDAGDDLIVDGDDGLLFGGDGSDILLLDLHDLGSSESELHGGDNVGTDGDDRVFVSGYYAKVDAQLGAGNDLYISYAVGDDGMGNSGDRVDRVLAEDGNDIVSTWFGDDTVDAGAGADVIWGGAGVDIIAGGDGTDILYGGAGDGDLLVGGGGIDYYYWARGDGDDSIDDQNGTIPGDPGENYIVVFPAFAFDANDADGLVDGQGVADPDRDIYDNDDTDGFGDDEVMIELADPGGDETLYYLHVLNADGSVNQSMLFDRDEISVIMLWNNDATGSTPVITGYRWVDDEMDPLGGRYQPV